MSSLATRRRPVLRKEYERMIDAGLFRGEHVELIQGIIVRMSPQGEPHSVVIQILTRILMPAVLGRADVRVQLPFAAGDDSLPEPDLALVEPGSFGQARPQRAFLIIEVSDSSLAEDRREKAPLYAAAGVPEMWIVNLPDRLIEVHAEPIRGAYARVTPYRIGQRVAPNAFPDVLVDVAALFAG